VSNSNVDDDKRGERNQSEVGGLVGPAYVVSADNESPIKRIPDLGLILYCWCQF